MKLIGAGLGDDAQDRGSRRVLGIVVIFDDIEFTDRTERGNEGNEVVAVGQHTRSTVDGRGYAKCAAPIYASAAWIYTGYVTLCAGRAWRQEREVGWVASHRWKILNQLPIKVSASLRVIRIEDRTLVHSYSVGL